MATYVLKNCKLYVHGYDLSGDTNEMNLDVSVDAPENTAFGASSRTRQAGGLTAIKGSFHGWYQADSADPQVDDVLDAGFGVQRIITVAPTTGADGEIAYCSESINTNYTPLGGTVGDMAGLSVDLDGSGEWVRGTVMKLGTVTTDANGTGRELGAVTAAQKVYAALHVLSVSTDDTIDVTIESDDNALFTTPITRLTFTQATAVTAEWKSLVGAISDTYWRAVWDVTGVADVSIKFAVTVGIK